MHNVKELSHEQLVGIVESIRAHLYLDTDSEGRQFWNPDRSWSCADVCEEAARLLDRHGLVPEVEQPVELSESEPASQPLQPVRTIIVSIHNGVVLEVYADSRPRALVVDWYSEGSSPDEAEFLEISFPDGSTQMANVGKIQATSLMALPGTDVAQALLATGELSSAEAETEPPPSRCECEEPGHIHCGVPGILALLEQGRLKPGAKAERCDLCQRYASDEAALESLRELGMADQQSKQQFNVHLYPVVRVTVPSVDAISQPEAISKALASIDLYARVCNAKVEYAEELAYYAVDVVGDEEFGQTRWYNCRETPYQAHLTRLVQWHDSGRPEDEMQQIIDEAREVLVNSI